ncbi:mycoredoxin [Actinotalea sp. K2]|uniref:mycoredoxin n=1 Tax=Actinotalea sp. K2 TaxID=2939438 RepID=UPI0020176390|nr:mycoredoxin [Actinotalea sp. K2]MCL3859856.1 mycoredoxin [Actinotalea sp. K2]
MSDATTTLPPAGTVTMYSTTWCGYCSRLKSQMRSAGVAFAEINIEQDPAAAAYVEHVNGGNQTVPTLVFPDGSAATNPSLAEVTRRLGG